ncbi:MAG: leucine-rich repeat protein, partial [Clostridia bacterium]|nr:leucine-rich repeat protein [Clostridia bacterium]
ERSKTCSACKDVIKETIPATGHDYGEWNETESATCTKDGEKERSCSTCGKVEKETILAHGHSYGEWEITTEAKCTEAGEKQRSCSECGKIETKTIEPLGHNYVNNECIRCHHVRAQSTEGVVFAYDSEFDGYYVKEYTGTASSVVIGASYDDGVHGEKSVTKIGEGAFIGNTEITTVVLPNTIRKILSHAFYDCAGLVDINIDFIPSEDIAADAFVGTMYE